MTRVHLYVHGRGRGHGQRAKAVGEHLREAGYALRIFAGPGALSAFDSGEAEAVCSLMPGAGIRSVWTLRERVSAAIRCLKADRPLALISDGDLPGALAAKIAGVPSIALGHGLVFSHTRRPDGLPAGPWRREAAKARAAAIGTERQIAVSFAPLAPKSERVTVARPPLRAALSGPRSEGDALVGYFRDPNAHALFTMLSRRSLAVRLFTPIDPQLPHLQWEPPHPQRFTDALLSARAVISSAGSQLMSECIALGIPQLALYSPEDDEQRLNVAMLEAFGLGQGCPLDRLTDERLDTFLRTLEGAAARRPVSAWGPDAGEATRRALDDVAER